MDFSTLQLAATSLAITGSKQSGERVSKHDLGHAAGLASTATASIGKFDKKLAGEKAPKNSGKRRKVHKVYIHIHSFHAYSALVKFV